ncbi:MAG: DUF1574 domain-containing protein [Cyanobacteria bacterium P01_D01_bin.71]
MTAKPSTFSTSPAADQSLSDWVAHQLAPSAQVQMRLRGNVLHVLSETPQPLHQSGAIARLVDALIAHPLGAAAITAVYPQAYQLYIYSRQVGKSQPDWTAPIYLNRLERHQAQLHHQAGASLKLAEAAQASQTDTAETAAFSSVVDDATTAIVLSHLSLAKQGDADAIAWYLSEVLSTLDVGVWVSVRAASRRVALQCEAVSVEVDPTAETPPAVDEEEVSVQRLWVWCEATYSPDPLLIAEPVTERLRQLALTQFKDAVIVIQVHGEDTPDWSLRIDLTPATEMLREWSRWGDEGAIARLLENAVGDHHATVTIERKDESLHAIVGSTLTGEPPVIPAENEIMSAISPLMEDLAPQGVHRLMVYGQASETDTPEWVRCLNLPALEHEALAIDPTTLAQQGDLAALAYLLTRLLNPDLDAQLATGGIRVQVLRRDQLLHVMTDAPICPTRRQVVPQVLDFLDFLHLTYIAGVRLYGRRAGQQRPAWSFGKDFQVRPEIVPKAEPIFAVSDRYVGDLLSHSDEAAVAAEAATSPISGKIYTAWQQGRDRVRQFLCDTQLVVPQQELSHLPPNAADGNRQDVVKIGLVWAAVGLLLALQADWIFGQIINPGMVQGALEAATAAESEQPEEAPLVTTSTSTPSATSAEPWARDDWETLDDESLTTDTLADEATAMDDADAIFNDEELIASPTRSLAATSDLLTHSPYPSFRSQQMDEKLALYHQRLEGSGPPDVLIIGSSRALRGVDPAALRRELMALGYGDLSVFNFGVNGATAQVVDLTIRRALKPHQLPRIIIWADGARAFNSGRTDVTYNAIAASEGFQELGRRNPDGVTAETAEEDEEAVAATEAAAPLPLGEALRNSYQALDETLSNQLGQRSAIYADRDELKAFVRDRLLTPLVAPVALVPNDGKAAQTTSDMPIPEGSEIDFDGFLALDVRFNPATYYQLYARVAGAYDSDYEDFGLDGEQTAAFEQLLNYTQQQSIPVIFVNTPLTDEYLDGYRSDAETDFQRLMLQYSATEENFIFRDLGQLWTSRYDYFSDPSHLNRYGAYQVSLRLAQDPMISWPRALDLSAAPSDETP